jgi:hypothetical protein
MVNRFVEQVKIELGIGVRQRQIATDSETYKLRESSNPYDDISGGQNDGLSRKNAYLWDAIVDDTDT